MRNRLIFSALFLLFLSNIHAQNTRIRNNNNIAWLNYFGTFHFSPKWSIHSEFQFRRLGQLGYGQQELYRIGINRKMNDQMTLRVGGAFVETHPYGSIPINIYGKPFSEYRSYEMLTIQNPVKKFKLSHRFMLEQRWVGKYSNENLDQEDIYSYLNRARYLVRIQSPEWALNNKESSIYLIAQNEAFVGFGKNVGENIFDQNRFSVQVGYKINKNLTLEGGFLSQMLQLPREIQGNNVVQYNRGITLNLMYQGFLYP